MLRMVFSIFQYTLVFSFKSYAANKFLTDGLEQINYETCEKNKHKYSVLKC